MATIELCGLATSGAASGISVAFYLDSLAVRTATIGSCVRYAVSGGIHYAIAQDVARVVPLKSIACVPPGACAMPALLNGLVQVTGTVGATVVVNFGF